MSASSFKGIYQSNGKNFRKPFHSFITGFSNLLIKAAGDNKIIENYLKSIKKWEEFKDTLLRRLNIQENTELGKKNITLKSNKEEEKTNKLKLNITHLDNHIIKGDEEIECDDIQDDTEQEDELTHNKNSETESVQDMYEDNNYWRNKSDLKIEDLESDYE